MSEICPSARSAINNLKMYGKDNPKVFDEAISQLQAAQREQANAKFSQLVDNLRTAAKELIEAFPHCEISVDAECEDCYKQTSVDIVRALVNDDFYRNRY